MNDKALRCIEPHIIDIAIWIDTGVSYRSMADKIEQLEGHKVSYAAVYRFAQRKGLVKRKKKMRNIFDDPDFVNSRALGCENCLYNATCRGTKHCHFEAEDLVLYHRLKGTKGA